MFRVGQIRARVRLAQTSCRKERSARRLGCRHDIRDYCCTVHAELAAGFFRSFVTDDVNGLRTCTYVKHGNTAWFAVESRAERARTGGAFYFLEHPTGCRIYYLHSGVGLIGGARVSLW